MSQFKAGCLVSWPLQDGNLSKLKTGEVVAVVSAGKLPSRANFIGLYAGAGGFAPRNHESYVVRVAADAGLGCQYFWPQVASLVAAPVAVTAVPLTVAAARALLAQMRDEDILAVPFEPTNVGLGPRATVSVVGAYAGFDWDAGKVMLATETLLGPSPEDLQAARRNSKAQSYELYKLRMSHTQLVKSRDRAVAVLASQTLLAADQLAQLRTIFSVKD